MAKTPLTLQKTVRTGLNPTYGAANVDGHGFNNNGQDVLIHVKNGGGGSIDVTFVTPNTVDGHAIADLVVAVPASGERLIGPFPRAVYNQNDSAGDTGIATAVLMTFSGVTSVTIAAIQMGDKTY